MTVRDCSFGHDTDGMYRVRGLRGVSIGVAGKSVNHTDYGLDATAVRLHEKSMLSFLSGIAEKDILSLNQLHGDEIAIVNDIPAENLAVYADADGMLTDRRRIALVIRSADCVPVFAFDPSRGVLGAAHSGWRGCRQNISGKLIRLMKERYGSLPADIRAFILPSIGPDSYTVSEDVAAHFNDYVTSKNGRLHLDLRKKVADSLEREGIASGNILVCPQCTFIDNREFFSHRRGDIGRNLNLAFLH